jgi:hypothetical protein
VVDAGTVFDVRRDSAGMSVAVSEGSVIFNPEQQKVHLGSGEMIARGEHSDRYVVSRVPVEQVGEWREGRITFRQASLAEIADRLSRASGIAYSAGRGGSVRAYSGSVLVARVPETDREDRDERGGHRPTEPAAGVPRGLHWLVVGRNGRGLLDVHGVRHRRGDAVVGFGVGWALAQPVREAVPVVERGIADAHGPAGGLLANGVVMRHRSVLLPR